MSAMPRKPKYIRGARVDVIQAPKLEPPIMRDELSESEWTAFRPRYQTRRVAFGEQMIVACSMASFGSRFRCAMPRHDRELWPYATCWAPASGSNLGPEHLSAGRGRDAAVQVMNTSVLRVHQHGRCIADNNHQDMGRSPGGLTSKIYAEVLTGPPRRTGMMFFAGV